MKKEHADTIADNAFLENKDKVWITILLIGGVAIFAAWGMDAGFIWGKQWVNQICSTELKCRLWQMAESVFNIVVTYSTMLVAVVVLFYSMFDNKRLGIPYRRLITYTIGSRTIPVLFVTVLVLTVVLSVIRFVPWRYTSCVCEVYILLIQVYVIGVIMQSTSYQHCKRVICRIEKKRYMEGAGLKREYNTEWAYFFGHLERAVHSEEFLPDKKEFLMDYLWIPFDRRTGQPCNQTETGEELGQTEELERIYQFYFVNILSAFQNFEGNTVYLERNHLYRCIGDFVRELSQKMCDSIKNDSRMRYVYHMVLSGIMNGLVSSNVEDKNDFCVHVLSHCIADSDAIRRQLHLFVLFQEVLHMINVDTVSNSVEFKNLRGWQLVGAQDVEFCAAYWQIWTQMYDLLLLDKVIHFENAMQTMSGRYIRSAAIFEMMIAMKETDKTKEKSDGR